jgi:hypothetical protein
MKIINRIEFLKLPENTVFSQYEPCVFHDIGIKGPNCGDNDFFLTSIYPPDLESTGTEDMMKILDDAVEKQKPFLLDFDTGGRDGCFADDNTLYAIWEREDIERLIKRLKECL